MLKLRRIAALLASAGMLLMTGCRSSGNSRTGPQGGVPEVTDTLTVTALDVGKADALIIQNAESVTVIDTGNKGDGKDIEKFLTKQGIDTIDTLIITHFDKDHVGGAARLVNRMKIGTVYLPDYTADSEEYLSFTEKMQEAELTPTVLPAGGHAAWEAGDAAFDLYAANEPSYGKNESNDFSLVLYVRHGKNSFLFAGDAEEARQQEIMNLRFGKVTFLKFPYHGNYLGMTERFLDECAPKVAVVCCSKKEFADPSTVETLQKRGVEAYYTENGTVTVVSDGETLTCTQETE